MPDLTAKQCKALRRYGNHRVAPQLYLQIRPHGTRSWLFRYRRGDKTTWLGLGAANLISLDAAKGEALAFRLMLRAGRDPLAERRAGRVARRGVPDFSTCAAGYIADHSAAWRNAKHAWQWSATLAKHAAPILGHLPVSDIEARHVAAALRPIWTSKAETATRLRGRIERVLDWSTAKGYRTGDNPAALAVLRHLLPDVQQAVKHHEAMPWREVPAFVAVLRARDTVSARALIFTILSASRTSEVIGAKWPEISGDLWTIPAARMKGGKPHRVPLPADVLLPDRGGDGYIFPGAKPGAPQSNMSMLKALRTIRPGRLTVHGFRSAFRDWAAENGHPRDVAEAALSHAVAKSKTEAAYLRTDHLEARRPLMAAWAAHCMGTQPPKELSAVEEALAGLDRRARRPGRLRIF